MTETSMKLEEWLDDLCVRFIINLPKEELESVERICFQVEEAQWFYEDFIRPLDPTLPSLSLRNFCLRIFQHCPLLSGFSLYHHAAAYSEFLAYKTRVPVRGAIMLNEAMDQTILVKGWKKGANWSFPRGKINKDEKDLDCAIREVYEETGYDIRQAGLIGDESQTKFIEVTMRDQNMRLYVFRGVPMDTYFEPKTRKEISKIQWHPLSVLPAFKKHKHQGPDNQALASNANKFYMVAPFLVPLRKWIAQQKRIDASNARKHGHLAPTYGGEDFLTEEEPLTENEARAPFPATHDQPRTESHPLSAFPSSMEAKDNGSEHLQRMLGMKSDKSRNTVPPPTTAPPDQSNLLLAMLHGTEKPGPGLNSSVRSLPQTPAFQIDSKPQQPQSPKHIQPSVSFSTTRPPPVFPLGPLNMYKISQPSAFPHSSGSRQHSQHINDKTSRIPDNFSTQSSMLFSGNQNPVAPINDTSLNRYATSTQSFEAPTHQTPPAPSFYGTHSPVVSNTREQASPKLTNHSLGLLEMLKNGRVPAPPTNVETPKALQSQNSFPVPIIKESIPNRAEPKPVSNHQSALLDLFQKGSSPSPAPPQSTYPKPSESNPSFFPSSQTAQKFEENSPLHSHMLPIQSSKPKQETKHLHHIPSSSRNEVGSVKSKGQSDHVNSTPSTSSHIPQMTILTRPSAGRTNENTADSVTSKGPAQARLSTAQSSSPSHIPKTQQNVPKTFQPQILQRPKQSAETPTPPHPLPPSLDRRDSQPEDQKQVLLSLFGKKAVPVSASTADPSEQHQDDRFHESSKPQNGSAKQPLDYAQPEAPSAFDANKVSDEVKSTTSPMTPQDRTFLLGYLHEVARGARR